MKTLLIVTILIITGVKAGGFFVDNLMINTQASLEMSKK